jgi:hypothetical protein
MSAEIQKLDWHAQLTVKPYVDGKREIWGPCPSLGGFLRVTAYEEGGALIIHHVKSAGSIENLPGTDIPADVAWK